MKYYAVYRIVIVMSFTVAAAVLATGGWVNLFM